MLAAYRLILPTALAPPVQVPLDFDSPFEMSGEPSKSRPAPKGEVENAPIEPIQQHNLEAQSSFVSHSNLHYHVNLSNMMHKVHVPQFHLRDRHPARRPQNLSNFHLPHISLPNLPWTHAVAHSTPVDAATIIMSWVPRADVRETESAYFVEIEVPGLNAGNEDQIIVQWMTPRTIVVSGDAQRSPLPALMGEPGKTENQSRSDNGSEDFDSSKRCPSADRDNAARAKVSSPPAPSFMISERHVGYWRRSFTLPADVDLDVDPSRNSSGGPLEYKIEAGVLTIRAPKANKRGRENIS
jgi:HSP20 family molecular chaperone IbpA